MPIKLYLQKQKGQVRLPTCGLEPSSSVHGAPESRGQLSGITSTSDCATRLNVFTSWPQFSHFQNGDDLRVHLPGFLWQLNELKYLAHYKHPIFSGKHLGESKELQPHLDSDNPAGSGKRRTVVLNLDKMAPRRLPTCLETLLVVLSRRAATGME